MRFIRLNFYTDWTNLIVYSEGELKLRVESEKKALEIQARLRAEEIASKNLVDVMTEQVVQEMCQEVARGTVATYQMDLVTDDIADSVIEEGIK